MKKLALFLFLLLYQTTSVVAAPLSHLWSKSFGDGYGEYINGIAVDPSGNVLVTGNFDSAIDLGGGPLVTSGDDGAFVAKFSPSGELIWGRGFHTSFLGFDAPVSDNIGNVIISGPFHGTLDFGGGVVLSGSPKGFIAKLDGNGNTLWAKAIATNGFNIAIDNANSLLIEQSFNVGVDLGGGFLPSAGYNDYYVARLDPNGNYLWSKRFGGPGDEQTASIVESPSGDFILYGNTYPYSNGGEINFGTGVLPSGGGWDIVIAKFDATGNCQWSARYGDATDQSTGSVALDGSGNVAITGAFRSSFQIGGTVLSSGTKGSFLAKLNPAGQLLWAKSWPTPFASAAMFDATGNLVVSGGIFGEYPVDFGGGMLTPDINGDVFVARFDSNGNHLASQYFEGPMEQFALDMCLDNAGDIVLSGQLMGSVDFGGGPLTATGYDEYHDWMEDTFLVKFSTQAPVPVLISSFNASVNGGVVNVRWETASDEPIDNMILYRRDAGETVEKPVKSISDPSVRSYTDRDVKPGKTYTYDLVIRTLGGNEIRSIPAAVTLPLPVAELKQNYPNPFNPRTTIEYVLSDRADVAIGIFNAAGALVAELPQGMRGPGTYRQEWDGRDAAGQSAASGVYFYRLLGVQPAPAQRKMILLK